jgi:hypothetical protein
LKSSFLHFDVSAQLASQKDDDIQIYMKLHKIERETRKVINFSFGVFFNRVSDCKCKNLLDS